MIATSRRTLIAGLISFVAAPAIVRAQSLMPVKVMVPEGWVPEGWVPINPAFLRVVHPDMYVDLQMAIQKNWPEFTEFLEDAKLTGLATLGNFEGICFHDHRRSQA